MAKLFTLALYLGRVSRVWHWGRVQTLRELCRVHILYFNNLYSVPIMLI